MGCSVPCNCSALPCQIILNTTMYLVTTGYLDIIWVITYPGTLLSYYLLLSWLCIDKNSCAYLRLSCNSHAMTIYDRDLQCTQPCRTVYHGSTMYVSA